MGASIDISGKKFGKLTAIERAGVSGSHTLWLTKCECGNDNIVTYSNLVSGNTTQCKKCYGESLRIFTDDEVDKMIAMKNDGISYAAIGREFGKSKGTVYKAVQKREKKLKEEK